MTREELKEIISRIIKKIGEDSEAQAPLLGCIFGDNCDVTTKYGVDEED